MRLCMALPDEASARRQGRVAIISWAFLFLILAALAAILGFSGLAGVFAWLAFIFFALFIAIAVVLFVLARKAAHRITG